MSTQPYLVQYTDGSVEVRLPNHVIFRLREGVEVASGRKFVEVSTILGIYMTRLANMNSPQRLAASVMMYMGIAMNAENEAIIVQALAKIAGAGVH